MAKLSYISQPGAQFLLDKKKKKGGPRICRVEVACPACAFVCACPWMYNITAQREHGEGGGERSELCYGCLLFSFFPEPQATGRHQGHLGATLLKYEMRGQ